MTSNGVVLSCSQKMERPLRHMLGRKEFSFFLENAPQKLSPHARKDRRGFPSHPMGIVPGKSVA